MLLPFFTMGLVSLVSLQALNQSGGLLAALNPKNFTLINYQHLLTQSSLFNQALNSLLVAVITTVGQVFFSAAAGYAFSRLKFKGSGWLFALCLGTLMLPAQVNLVPLFWLMAQLGWVNSYQALIVPGLFSGMGVFWFRQWFNSLPPALEEAAWLEGCSPGWFFVNVALPLAQPALLTWGLFTFLASWNSFLWPLVITHSEAMRTLPVGLAILKQGFRDVTDWPLLMAASTVAILPVVVLFLVGQKALKENLLGGSVKG